MSPRIQSLFALTVAVTSAACSATPTRPVAPARALVECAGGSIATPEQAASFAGCEVVTGDLAVRGSKLFDLGALSELAHVSGSLVIENNARLDSLHGLERLSAVGSLEIRNNERLESLAELDSLSLAKNVTIAKNAKLRNLSGLEGLSEIERLVINDNGLFNSTGLDGLTSVDEIVIQRNAAMISLSGFGQLRRAGRVEVSDNPRLCGRLGLFPRLEVVERELSISRNWGLSDSDIDSLKARTGHVTAVARRGEELALGRTGR